MFAGEMLCLIPFFIRRWWKQHTGRLDELSEEEKVRQGRALCCAVLCNAGGEHEVPAPAANGLARPVPEMRWADAPTPPATTSARRSCAPSASAAACGYS